MIRPPARLDPLGQGGARATDQSARPRIALACGDPNGIGPEIALKAAAAIGAQCRITLFGPVDVWLSTATQLGLLPLLERVSMHATRALNQHRPGLIDAQAGLCMLDAATQAIAAGLAGQVDAVVAAPHHEQAVVLAGVPFSGYPGLVAKCAGIAPEDTYLMLDGAGLRIVHATLHESVLSAVGRLTQQRVAGAIRCGVRAIRRMGVPCPRVAVFGLNPHASEGGLWGTEDEAVVRPAVNSLASEGWHIDGPAGADMLLAQRAHDLYVAMLHDQGHIPIKLLAPQAATAWTLCGDLLFASVAHGSAMDIAGRGIARPDALLRTLRALLPPASETAQ
jgi:1,2-dihydroxy-3,5-cyclohexadiene-1,4-dicarboxylate dehydrogenase